MQDEPWYGVKCIFLHHDLKNRNGQNNFEERVILVYANSFDDAIEKAEKEAKLYCEQLETVEYLKFCNAYRIGESQIEDGTEIYSLITKSDLSSADFINTHHATGGETTLKNE